MNWCDWTDELRTFVVAYCEDYALLKRHELMQLGWPSSALLMTVVMDESFEGHAVLTSAQRQALSFSTTKSMTSVSGARPPTNICYGSLTPIHELGSFSIQCAARLRGRLPSFARFTDLGRTAAKKTSRRACKGEAEMDWRGFISFAVLSAGLVGAVGYFGGPDANTGRPDGAGTLVSNEPSREPLPGPQGRAAKAFRTFAPQGTWFNTVSAGAMEKPVGMRGVRTANVNSMANGRHRRGWRRLADTHQHRKARRGS